MAAVPVTCAVAITGKTRGPVRLKYQKHETSKLSKRFAAAALLTEVSRLVAVLSPLLHSPLEPALLTQFTGVGLSLAISGPIPRSVNCAHVPSAQRLQVLPAVVSRSDFSRLCLSTPPPGACETRVAPTRAAQRAGWGLVFSFQLPVAVEQKIIYPLQSTNLHVVDSPGKARLNRPSPRSARGPLGPPSCSR